MNKERLSHLASLLDNHRDNGVRFNLWTWLTEGAEEEDWCGTKACAVGLATADPWFQKQGLGMISLSPTYHRCRGWSAIAYFFGLENERQAHYLFSAYGYPDGQGGNAAAAAVAQRIRDVLQNDFPDNEAILDHMKSSAVDDVIFGTYEEAFN